MEDIIIHRRPRGLEPVTFGSGVPRMCSYASTTLRNVPVFQGPGNVFDVAFIDGVIEYPSMPFELQ
jgi:hypothetical protein